MAAKQRHWKKGRGKLGVLAPLMGTWHAVSDSPMGKVACTRTFTPMLNKQHVQLTAVWKFGKTVYEEHAVISVKEGQLQFWSFTSDGNNTQGYLADGSDVHPEALCFEAQMPAGLARMVYWPDEKDGFYWAVESKTKKGWNRFTEHYYTKVKA